MAITYMTKEGYDRKLEEIAYLETVKRPEISRAIAEARDKGDLSENSEYDAAKEAQGMLEMKIAQLKDLVANARIIDESRSLPMRCRCSTVCAYATWPPAAKPSTRLWPTAKPT